MAIPQFGEPEPGRDYPDRPAAFVLVEDMGQIALVKVDLGGGRTRIDLPGGGLEPGETPEQAAVRECGEEAGLRVAPGEIFERADQYFINPEGRSTNTRSVFLTARLEGEAPELKIEDDHELIWCEPLDALMALYRDSHAWAVAAWLRRVRG